MNCLEKRKKVRKVNVKKSSISHVMIKRDGKKVCFIIRDLETEGDIMTRRRYEKLVRAGMANLYKIYNYFYSGGRKIGKGQAMRTAMDAVRHPSEKEMEKMSYQERWELLRKRDPKCFTQEK